jgi:hypothetical protein
VDRRPRLPALFGVATSIFGKDRLRDVEEVIAAKK